MDSYINKYKNFDKIIVFDWQGRGGIGDYFKFYMICLTECINNNIKFYNKLGHNRDKELGQYIKFKYNIFNINGNEISKLQNAIIKTPPDYFHMDIVVMNFSYVFNISLNEIFYFDDIIKNNVNKIFPSLPNNYISIHLRLGDKFLETDDRMFSSCETDIRPFSEDKLYKFIEDNNDKNIVFFCDNNNYKLKIKNKYKNIITTNAKIGHTAIVNISNEQILDAITEFYLISNSTLIIGASRSGFSIMASKFKNVEYVSLK